MSDANPAVEAVRAKALAVWHPGQRYAFHADPHTYANGKKPAVLLAIVTRAGSLVLALDMAEWNSPGEHAVEMILEFIGLEKPTAMERATQALAK